MIALSRQVATQLELRLKITRLEHAIAQHSPATQPREQISQSAFDGLGQRIAVLDGTGTIVATNAAWNQFARANGDPDLRHTGVGVNYLAVCQVSAAVVPTSDTKLTADAKAAMAVNTGLRQILNGSLRQFAYEYPCHSLAEKRWFSLTATPLLQPHTGAVVAHTDITNHRLAASAAGVQARLLEAVQQAIIVTDLAGNIRYWNHFAETCFGWPAAEVMARKIADVITLEYSQAQMHQIMSELHRGQSWSGEFLAVSYTHLDVYKRQSIA